MMPFSWIEYVVIFLVGLPIGSFLNVVIYRIPIGQSIVFPASHCVHCKQKIKSYLNIPLISYVLLRGRCSVCKVVISAIYPIVEGTMGLLLVILLYKFGWTWELLIFGTLSSILLCLSVIDIQVKRLPNAITLTGTILALIFTLFFRPDQMLNLVFGGLVGVGFLLMNWLIGKMIFKRDGVGMGDIKMAGMIGLFLGPLLTAVMFVISVFVAALIGGTFILIGKKGMFYKIPFGPYMAIATIIVLLYGEQLWLWYARFAGLI
jgi:leader peptidase (prepilin peptidase) / N-methyltransferase